LTRHPTGDAPNSSITIRNRDPAIRERLRLKKILEFTAGGHPR
jgi:hypothetical protein